MFGRAGKKTTIGNRCRAGRMDRASTIGPIPSERTACDREQTVMADGPALLSVSYLSVDQLGSVHRERTSEKDTENAILAGVGIRFVYPSCQTVRPVDAAG